MKKLFDFIKDIQELSLSEREKRELIRLALTVFEMIKDGEK